MVGGHIVGTTSPINILFVASMMDEYVVSLKLVLLMNNSLILMLVDIIQSSINSLQSTRGHHFSPVSKLKLNM